MEVPPPIKPPRGVKPTKETGGLLMTVIRTLSTRETNEQRDREKANIEKDYKKSDERLDDLVSSHDKDLTQVMQLFSTLSAQVSESRENIRKVKESLQTCKNSLHCKRDELKKLWFEGLEYKYILQLLDEVDQLNEVPNKLSDFLMRKHYLHATKLLVNAVSLGKGTLDGVQGIRELNDELEQKKQMLYGKLLEELHNHLYVRTAQEALALRRQGSGREGVNFASPFQRTAERLSNRQRTVRKNLFEISQMKVDTFNFDIEEDTDLTDPEADSSKFMAIIVRCFSLLDKLPVAIETIKMEIQKELLCIVHRTTLSVNDFVTLQTAELKSQNKANALPELMQTIFEQFRSVAQAHVILLNHLSKSVEKHNLDVKLYDIQEFWAKVQVVLQFMLTDYLDIQNINSDPQLNMVIADSEDLSSYFSRRKVQSKKKGALFKFDGSSSAISMSSFTNDADATGTKDKILVCNPDPNNITLIFVPLMCFIEEIEHAMSMKPGNMCALNTFLSNYITEIFLVRHKTQIQSKVEVAIRAADAWKATVQPDPSRDAKPLLQSTYRVEQLIQESRDLMRFLPLYGEKILKEICHVLKEYRDTCQAAYRGIVQPHPEDRRICSAVWLKSEEIGRCLKDLLNRTTTKAHQEQRADRRRVLRRENTEEESPEEVRKRNLREAQILVNYLGRGNINSQEIISDMNLLKGLALLQESMEWFSTRIIQFANEFRHDPSISPDSKTDRPPPVSSSTLQSLTTIGQDFVDLANMCLLLLHLEVRIQCFHYLSAHHDYNRETQEPDSKVMELSRVLGNVDEAMNSCLHPRKCKFIFEGLGHLIAKRLISLSASEHMNTIDETGIQRMCRNVFALQQTLTNITMTREFALDHAKHYYELFYLSPEEILNGVIDKGPEFSELEYKNAFELLRRSRGRKDRAIDAHIEKLSEILREVGVTV